MKKAILIQARLSSSRFPKKMLKKINDITLAEYVYLRCKESKKADKVIIITSKEESDDELYELCVNKNIDVYRGDLNNVLSRYIFAAKFFNVDVICRVCGDSPFVDIKAIDKIFSYFESNTDLNYMSTVNSLNGFMSEVFSSNLLNKVYNERLSKEDKEHVTKYIRDNIVKYNTKEIDLDLRPKELEKYTLTVDYPDDILIAQKIAKHFKNFNFKSDNIINILKQMEDNK